MNGRDDREEFRKRALAFLLDLDEGPLSFRWVCTEIGIDPDWLLRRIGLTGKAAPELPVKEDRRKGGNHKSPVIVDFTGIDFNVKGDPLIPCPICKVPRGVGLKEYLLRQRKTPPQNPPCRRCADRRRRTKGFDI